MARQRILLSFDRECRPANLKGEKRIAESWLRREGGGIYVTGSS